MIQEPRNELLSRVSSIIGFLYAEELAAIPSVILKAASARGTENHNIIEVDYDRDSNNIISLLFKEGLTRIFTPEELREEPVFEEQINGAMFTGKPDFRLLTTLIDYKFSVELRAVTALQLLLYAMLIYEKHGILISRRYAFHYPRNLGLFIHKIPDRAMEPLTEYVKYILVHEKAIAAEGVERYEAKLRWEKLLQDYEVFELVDVVLPPAMITDEVIAGELAIIYCKIKIIKDREELIKRELIRYMESVDENEIVGPGGYAVKLSHQNRRQYDVPKHVKEQYYSGTKQSDILRRVMPAPKQISNMKQLN